MRKAVLYDMLVGMRKAVLYDMLVYISNKRYFIVVLLILLSLIFVLTSRPSGF